jgi:hypothetical protein
MRVTLVCFLSSIAFGQFATVTTEIKDDTMTVTFADPVRDVAPIAPFFSGQQEVQTVRMLPDRRLELRVSGQKMWRDSQGRTRTERELGPPHYPSVHGVFILTEIRDPMNGVYYVLDDRSRIAHRLILSESLMRAIMPATPRKIHVGCAAQTARSAVRLTCAESIFAERNVEGVMASGWRLYSIVTGPTDDRPLIVTDEEWYSQELGMTVLSRHSDPREGETIMRWINMSRVAADMSMFVPPKGYRVVDEKDSFSIALKKQY